MRQFILPVEEPGNRIILTEKDYHYLMRVRRMKEGDTFTARTGTGRGYTARINKVLPRSCELVLTPLREEENSRPATEIVLIQGMAKGKKMDLIVRQSVECGVSRIIPLVSEYTVVQVKEGRGAEKQKRWEKIAREAVQQSGSEVLPDIVPAAAVEEIPEAVSPGSLGLFFHQTPLEHYPLHRYLSSDIKTLYLGIGPEGGFSEKEVELFRTKGYKPVFLGKNILRTETAAVYVLGAVQTLITERQAWKTIQ